VKGGIYCLPPRRGFMFQPLEPNIITAKRPECQRKQRSLQMLPEMSQHWWYAHSRESAMCTIVSHGAIHTPAAFLRAPAQAPLLHCPHTHSCDHLEQTLFPQPSYSIPNKHARSHIYTHACMRTHARKMS
jgi:hypothetical protein